MKLRVFSFFLAVMLLLLLPSRSRAEVFDFATVVTKTHPRLIMSDSDFKEVRRAFRRKSSPNVIAIHEILMAQTEGMRVDNKNLTFVPDGVKNPLNQSREFLMRSLSCAYAYRFTKDKNYVRMSEPVISYMCDHFDKWMEESPTDAFIIEAEFALGIAIAYDWMYKALSPTIKAKMEQQMKRRMLDHPWKEGVGNNRSQVCNASWFACAAALAEMLDPVSMTKKTYERVENLRQSMVRIYAPDGAANESASYWSYGSNFQAFALAVLYSAYGTDFGLCNVQGFKQTLDYRTHSVGNLGFYFNCGDCNVKVTGEPCVWYYAWLFDRPDVLQKEVSLLSKGSYKNNRAVLLAMLPAVKLGIIKTCEPKDSFYSAHGEVPVILARTGWTRSDAFFGIKGGCPLSGHAHMDEGTFIYEAFGVRWATDLPYATYQLTRNILNKLNVKSNPKEIDNPCWSFFEINNQQHNTLTVNGHRQIPQGKADWESCFNTPEKKGATFDISSLYSLDLTSFKRSGTLYADQSLEIVDDITVNEKGEANIRWTLCTEVKPEIKQDCIILKSKGVTMEIRTDAPGAKYQIWSSNPSDYETQTSKYEDGAIFKNYWLCGYTFTLPALMQCKFTTTFRRIQ